MNDFGFRQVFTRRHTDDALAAMHRRCGEIVEKFDMPTDLDEFLERISLQQRRPVIPIAMALPPEGPTGAIVYSSEGIFVPFSKHTSQVHRHNIVLHELGHLLFGHNGITDVDRERSQAMFPDLDPDLVISMLQRTNYSDDQEKEAELFASVMGMKLATWSPKTDQAAIPPEIAAAIARIEKVLGSAH
ncbi:hypothetical protein [Nocardia sp. NPDC050435]|uniref:ImmA/IrrE family metallo-endopeptidase n=1 Tax=Nocardia sp. NPDC050435 TaxID=3155040 RepID=UPI0033D1A4AC